MLLNTAPRTVIEDTRNQIVTLRTSGKGYWSRKAAAVKVTQLIVPFIFTEIDFCELRVAFNTTSWNIDRDGLIYSDALFKEELIAYLGSVGIDASDISYSEQGMQGCNYVSFDAGPMFINSWVSKYPNTPKV